MNKYLLALIPCLSLSLARVDAAVISLVAHMDCAQANAALGTCSEGGSGSGTGNMTFDTASNRLSWEVSYTGLSSAVSAAHFHGPAAPNENAGIEVIIGPANPAADSIVLSAAQAADLLAGRWYINIHSTNFPGGEIRGQVSVAPQCDIRLDATAYFNGETVNVDVLRLANPSAAAIAAELKIWLGVPGLAPVEIVNTGADGSLLLPAGIDIDYGPLALLPIDAGLPVGSYEFSCRMLDPVTGMLLVEDRNFFAVSTSQPPAPAPQSPGDLVITEIMIDPEAVPDLNGEWFEIHNPTSTDFDLRNLVVADEGGQFFVIGSSVPVPAGGFATLGILGNTAVNGGVDIDYEYSSFTLDNSSDEIIIFNAGTIIDRVDYVPGSFPLRAGFAASLDVNSFDSIANDDPANWCLAVDRLPQGDNGSPGASNPPCP